MDLYYNALDVLRTSLLFVGSVTIFIGIARAVLEALRTGFGPRVARRILDHMALGSEFFIGAGILNLILDPTWAAVQTAVLIIAVRELITISLKRLVRGAEG